MFDSKKNEILRKKIETLEEQNNVLKMQVKELNTRIENMDSIIKAAENCIETNKNMTKELGLAKSQYEAAIKQIKLMKKEYKQKMDELLKSI